MKRRHWHPASCKVCGRQKADGWHITQTGLCLDDAVERFEDNLLQLKAHSGPRFNYWRQRIAASVGGVLLDDS